MPTRSRPTAQRESPARRVDPTTLLASNQVLERYPHLSYRTLSRLITDGKLTAYHVAGGRRRLFDPIEIEALFVPGTNGKSRAS